MRSFSLDKSKIKVLFLKVFMRMPAFSSGKTVILISNTSPVPFQVMSLSRNCRILIL